MAKLTTPKCSSDINIFCTICLHKERGWRRKLMKGFSFLPLGQLRHVQGCNWPSSAVILWACCSLLGEIGGSHVMFLKQRKEINQSMTQRPASKRMWCSVHCHSGFDMKIFAQTNTQIIKITKRKGFRIFLNTILADYQNQAGPGN